MIVAACGLSLGEDPSTLDRIEDEFWACVRGQRTHPAVRLTKV